MVAGSRQRRRSQKQRAAITRGARALCSIVVLLVGGAGIRAVWRSVRSRAEFTVSSVRVAGTNERIAEEVRALAGVPLGTNTWDIDLLGVRERVLGHLWVAEAEVRRELPDGIVVTVEERRALAALDVEGVPYGVDRRGQLFAPLDADHARTLPRITGLGDVRRVGTQTQAIQQVQEVQLVRMLRRATALVRVAGRCCRLAEVRIDPVDGLTVLTEELGDVPVRFGWRRWRAKERRLDTVVTLWAGREADLETVSLAFRDQVVVQLRRGVPVESAAGREPSGT